MTRYLPIQSCAMCAYHIKTVVVHKTLPVYTTEFKDICIHPEIKKKYGVNEDSMDFRGLPVINKNLEFLDDCPLSKEEK